MSLVAEEIRDQPHAWARALTLAPQLSAALAPGERVAAIGCGSSWHVAKALAALRESAPGGGPTDAFAASEALLERGYDRVVAISRSGATTEILQALRAAPELPVVALVGDLDSPLAATATQALDLSFADDRAVVQTRFVTTAICLARAALGFELDRIVEQAQSALTAALPVSPGEVDHVVLLGRAWRVGLADAGALSLCETAGIWAESHPSMEYRHGPISTASKRTLAWFLDEPPAALADEIAATGAAVEIAASDPLAELIRVQRLAVSIAEHRGLDPDSPAHLARAVVLEADPEGEPS